MNLTEHRRRAAELLRRGLTKSAELLRRGLAESLHSPDSARPTASLTGRVSAAQRPPFASIFDRDVKHATIRTEDKCKNDKILMYVPTI